MQQLVDAVVSHLLHRPCGSRLRYKRFNAETTAGWFLPATLRIFRCSRCCYARPAAAALRGCKATELVSELSGIQYTSSLIVTLGYDQHVRASLPPGFGFLVPRSEGKRMLAATFVHNKFPFRAPEDRALLRCFLGGVRDELVLQLPDEEILRIVREELRQIIC